MGAHSGFFLQITEHIVFIITETTTAMVKCRDPAHDSQTHVLLQPAIESKPIHSFASLAV